MHIELRLFDVCWGELHLDVPEVEGEFQKSRCIDATTRVNHATVQELPFLCRHYDFALLSGVDGAAVAYTFDDEYSVYQHRTCARLLFVRFRNVFRYM